MNNPYRLRTLLARSLRLFACVASLVTLTACDSKPNPDSTMRTALPPGVDKNTPYGQWWTDKPALFNMSEHLKLAVPPQYQRFWLQRDEVTRAPADITKLPMHPLNSGAALEFHFFLPDFTGFTPKNYEDEFHQDKVYVLIEAVGMGQEKLGAPGAYPPNMFQRSILEGGTYDPQKFEMHHGLQCYWSKQTHKDNTAACYAFSSDTRQAWFQIHVPFPPHPEFMVNPLIQSRYFSTSHGGVLLMWRTHVKNFDRWKEIDQKIWEFIAEWNVAKTPSIPSNAPMPPQKP